MEKCSEALAFEKQYLELHSRFTPDRGCEGTLVSYMAASPQLLISIMSEFGGAEIDLPGWEDTFDAPPEPLVIN